jgi:RsiW-degrading membrane proteinase PrsW (M82 family)
MNVKKGMERVAFVVFVIATPVAMGLILRRETPDSLAVLCMMFVGAILCGLGAAGVFYIATEMVMWVLKGFKDK